MELIKETWDKSDIVPFQEYLLSLSKGKEKGEWEKRIVNTQMPCIAVPSPKVKEIITNIFKGNYKSFLDLWIWENLTNTFIIGGLICRIKDFNEFEKYLDKFVAAADNWATVDGLKLKVTDKNKAQFFALSEKYIKSKLPFVRRCGLTILFKFVDDNNYIDRIYNIMNRFEGEQHYYVNMANAWLFAECFTKQREKTLQFIKTHKLNKFTINKGISKCRDSFRISQEDKDFLLRFRVK